jgi:type IV pilus assembly protein PilA
MAILAGAIAPALIKYIDKSRKSNDVSSAKTIKTAVETALGNEAAYEEIVCATGTVINITPGKNISDPSVAASACIAVAGGNTTNPSKTQSLIADALSYKTPKIKFKKGNMAYFVVLIDKNGTVSVGVSKATMSAGDSFAASGTEGTSDSAESYELAPDLADFYQ